VATLNLERILKRKKLSKRKFAKLIGVRYENVFRYFRPGQDPRLSALSKWAKALRCKVRDLLRE
jgi:DNA-binding Xre family transcriptional regulator